MTSIFTNLRISISTNVSRRFDQLYKTLLSFTLRSTNTYRHNTDTTSTHLVTFNHFYFLKLLVVFPVSILCLAFVFVSVIHIVSTNRPTHCKSNNHTLVITFLKQRNPNFISNFKQNQK
jgi:hypothetical protein